MKSKSAVPAETDVQKQTPVFFHFLAFFTLFLSIALSYGFTLNYSFHFDDLSIQNGTIQIAEFSWEKIRPILSGIRPLAFLSFALNYYFGGVRLPGYHLVNLGIHLLNACLVYFLFLKTVALTRDQESFTSTKPSGESIALLAAALWAVHPVQTEAVTFIVQRVTALAALFSLSSLVFYLLGRQNAGRISFIYFSLSFLSLLMAFSSKENTLTFPIVILVYEIFFIRKFTFRLSRKQWIILTAVCIGLIGGAVKVLERHAGSFSNMTSLLAKDYGAGTMDPVLRVMTEWRVMIYYLTLLIFPSPGRMNLDYDLPMSMSLFSPFTTFLSLLAISLLLGFAVMRARKYPLISFSILWFFINLLIESSFVSLDLVFEHRLYLPSVMLFLPLSVVILSAGRSIKSSPVKSGAVFGVILVLLLIGVTLERNKVWESEISLWSDVVLKSPLKERGHYNLGKAFAVQGDFPRAIREYQEAIRLDPNFPNAHFNLGDIYLLLNEMNSAISEFQYFIKLKYPDDYYNSKAHTKLGVLYTKKGMLAEADKEFREGVALDQKSTFSLYNYALFLAVTGRQPEALEAFNEAKKWVQGQNVVTSEMIDQKIKLLIPQVSGNAGAG